MDNQARFLKYLSQTSPEPIGIEVASAEGSWIVDAAGRRYLDFISGIGVANVGHRHPAVLAAIREQIDRYLHVMVYGEYVQTPQVELAERLAKAAPDPLSVTYLTNSGAEAVEGALKLARKFTGRSLFVAFERSYHGDTLGAMSVMGQQSPRAPYEPLLPARILPWDDPAALEAIDDRAAAVIMEPIQAEGGVRLPSPDFLARVRRRCTEAGALLLLDEVVTGFGRTGRLFALEHWGVEPDLLILAKAMGGGMPLGGFMGRPELMATLSDNPPLSHLTTFGGHPVSCAAGLASLRVIQEERLAEAAVKTGRQLLDALAGMTGLGGLKGVRGLGLLIGMEFEAALRCEDFAAKCRKQGLLLGWTLHHDRVVRLAPPLNLTADELDHGLAIIQQALRQK
ncbi:MAG: aspartate aminotransferase family protein [Nitrospirota bacterium]